ncbi:hypothetical protein DTO96_102143 [Ephemeroptericola cinctiostellae]|uniref:Phage tail collar domain-containing protein n=1 Tax=Ephemeroptericola cinctiostellae TaxID=2268024 RepID=A0A345DDF1_9BURK|nr:tail fiber protein [Ephemeroptericola cinctiostellae]AXF86389.1 hypothetical protein DTO96_102143 [Ephemeroptericola cinctiostellae]
MDYTKSSSYSTDTATGNRMHDSGKAIPTEVSSADMNGMMWEVMSVIKYAGITPKSFNVADESSYTQLLASMKKLAWGSSTASSAADNAAYVKQGGGVGQSTNKVMIGWTGSKLKATVDVSDQGNFVFDKDLDLYAETTGNPIHKNGVIVYDNPTSINGATLQLHSNGAEANVMSAQQGLRMFRDGVLVAAIKSVKTAAADSGTHLALDFIKDGDASTLSRHTTFGSDGKITCPYSYGELGAAFGRRAGDVGLSMATTPPKNCIFWTSSMISVSAYPDLFALFGFTYGGDNSTLFKLPTLNEGDALVATLAQANVGGSTIGENLSHTHTLDRPLLGADTDRGASGYASNFSLDNTQTATTSASGGTRNLAAGLKVRVFICYKAF